MLYEAQDIPEPLEPKLWALALLNFPRMLSVHSTFKSIELYKWWQPEPDGQLLRSPNSILSGSVKGDKVVQWAKVSQGEGSGFVLHSPRKISNVLWP